MKLHDYQEVAVGHLRRNPRAGLFLDMGLGKTACVLSALGPEHLPVLVVAPKRVAENVWPAETAKWRPDLSIAVAKGDPDRRREALASRKAITVISRDNLGDALAHGPYKTIVIDELSSFKTRNTIRWRTARKLTGPARYVWGLTGTPAPNGLLDLWPQLYLIDKGERLGTTLTGYRDRYFNAGRRLPSGVVIEWNLKPEADKAIQAAIDDICLAMETDGRIELPPVTYNPVVVELPPLARQTYKALKRDMVANMTLLGEDAPGLFTAGNAAALSNRLSQVASGFLYQDVATLVEDPGAPVRELHRAKLAAVEEIVELSPTPVLVFYRYLWERDQLLRMDGAVSIDEHDAIERWDRGEVRMLVTHPASAGHGLNLQYGGHTIVWCSMTWPLEEWQQANKRLARQGQAHPVVIHMVIANHTVDEVLRARLVDKADVQKALTDHLESPI